MIHCSSSTILDSLQVNVACRAWKFACALVPAYVPCTQKLLNEHVKISTQISRFFWFQKSKEHILQKCWTKLNRSKFLNVVVLKVPFDSSLRKIEIIYVFSNHQTYLNNWLWFYCWYMDKVFVDLQGRVAWGNLGRILHNFDFFSKKTVFGKWTETQ